MCVAKDPKVPILPKNMDYLGSLLLPGSISIAENATPAIADAKFSQ